MCCCEKPNVNGNMGYRWQPNDKPGICPVAPPKLEDGDSLIFDEPGRCGNGCDSHSYHYSVVQNRSTCYLLVSHGGGEERIGLGRASSIVDALRVLTSNSRYWMLNAIYHAQAAAARKAREDTNAHWRRAAAEKRIKTRKRRNQDLVTVWIE